MKTIGIAEFRDNLSHYLDLVEEKKETIQISNYNIVVAKIVPVKSRKNKKKCSSKK